MSALHNRHSKHSNTNELNTENFQKEDEAANENAEIPPIDKASVDNSEVSNGSKIIDYKVDNEDTSMTSAADINKLSGAQESLIHDQNSKMASKIYSRIGLLPESEPYLRTYGLMNSELLTNMVGCIVRFTADELKLVATNYKRGPGDISCSVPIFTLEEKCTKPLFELHDYPTYLLGKDEMAYTFYKFEMDTCFIEKLLMSMAKEIIRTKSFWGFAQILRKVADASVDEEEYLNESRDFRDEIYKTQTTGCKEKLKHYDEMANLNEQLALCKNKLQDIKRDNYIKEQYIDKWENSRNRQNHIMYKQRIESLEREIKEYRSKIEREKRVNKEVERYTNLVLVDCQNELTEWSQRYETELEQKETKIQSIKQSMLDISEKLTKLKIKYDKQAIVLKEGRARRADLLKRKQLFAMEYAAAVKIQWWWRRIRFRKALLKKKRKRGIKKADHKGKGVKAKGK